MVNNVFIQCNACKMKINLRVQIGLFDIPFHVRCPKCHSTIYGKVFVEDNNIDVENANIVQCDDEEFYSVELSAEFPTRKVTRKKIYEIELSPYMRNLLLYGSNEKAIEETQKTMYFANFVKSGLSEMKQNFELFWNNQDKILFARVTDMIKQYPYIPFSEVNNYFDAAVALHQLLLTTTGISSIIGKDTLGEYTKIGKLVIEDRNHLTQIREFIANSRIDFNSIEIKGFKLIELFAKIYEQLIPVIALKNGDCLENVDKNQFGIMTANFDELTDFYAKSYEWIFDNLKVILGLNNIFVRNDSTKCANGKTYQDFIRESNGNKMKNGYVDEKEPFGKPISSLNNRVRNAIQHFDSDIDYETQLITFKDRNKSVDLYLIDFADLCIENFRIIFYVLELVYNLRKLDFIQKGIAPSFVASKIRVDGQQQKKKKIGRNEPCPCGSGKKYKRCCGK